MSERRACSILGCSRMSVRYCSRRADDAQLCERLRLLAHERRRLATGGCMFCFGGRGLQ